MKNLIFVYVLFVFFCVTSCSFQQEKKPGKKPSGIEFKPETLKRVGSRGDNWCITWAKDGSQVTSMCDGNWLNFKNAYGGFHNHLYRITGDARDFNREDIPNYPEFGGGPGSWFGYGIISVGGDIFSAISKTPGESWSGPFRGVKLLKSPDNGKSWFRVDRNGEELLLGVHDSMRNVVNKNEMFFFEESGIPHVSQHAYPFSFMGFVQAGQDNSASDDGYVYIYSPEGAQSNKLLLARVLKGKLGNRGEWQYFTHYNNNKEPQWTKDLDKRGTVYSFPEKNNSGNYFGWYSWLPSVVWNEGLGLYIMANGGTYGGQTMTNSDKDYYDWWMHTETGSLGFWYSKKPFGPWKQFFYTDKWTVDNEKNRTYQPKLSPKWISDDGKKMILIWSDAMKNDKGQSHSVNYIWNQMEIEIVLSGSEI